ncbi:MAG: hypothetical protein Kapaf2KO_02330 [Candidatus Kapaibacteriales bacterium]
MATKNYPGFNVGVYGGLNYNMYSNDVIYLLQYSEPIGGVPVVLDTFQYRITDPGSGFDFNAGLIVNYPFNEYLTLSGRLGYNGLSGVMSQEFVNDENYSNPPLQVDGVNTTTEYDVNLSYFEISPMLQIFNVIPVDNLYLLVGPELGIPINGEITDNSSQTLNGEATNFTPGVGGDIEDLNFRFALGIGVGYSYEISDDIYLTPELSYRLAFTDVVELENDQSWRANQLRFGLALTFDLSDDEEPAPPVEDDMLDVGFNSVSYLDNSGNKKPVNVLKVEEVKYSELYPLVPHVYFEQNSSDLGETEQRTITGSRTGEFMVDDLSQDVLEINNNTLNIVGSRMKKYPDSEVTLLGTNDGKEKGGIELSKNRAQSVKDYLVKNYNVNGSKINVKSQNLPDKPSTSRVEEGMAENRRVEIYTKNPNILEPVILQGDKTTVSDPNLIIFTPSVNSNQPIGEWNMTISQSGKQLKQINGLGEPGDISWSIKPDMIQQSNVPIDYALVIENSNGMKKMATGSIPVEFMSYELKKSEENAGKTISRYSLVVFDFDSPNISEYDQKIIDKYVLPAIKGNSTVKIYGYTDNIGSEEYNKTLAGKRAKSVEDYLKKKSPSPKYEVYAVGEEAEMVSNSVPVGRQLSRTVQITVITPNQ